MLFNGVHGFSWTAPPLPFFPTTLKRSSAAFEDALLSLQMERMAYSMIGLTTFSSFHIFRCKVCIRFPIFIWSLCVHPQQPLKISVLPSRGAFGLVLLTRHKSLHCWDKIYTCRFHHTPSPKCPISFFVVTACQFPFSNWSSVSREKQGILNCFIYFYCNVHNTATLTQPMEWD